MARARALALEVRAGVLSLDVFDTLLWRAVPEPADAFVLIGQAQAAAGHLTVPAQGFRVLRQQAEAAARQRGERDRSSTEVSLEEVYAELPPGLTTAPAAALAEVEVVVERGLTFPDLAVAELARSLALDHGLRVVLVSNTYLSAAQLRRLLEHEPLADLPLAGVFASSEHRVHKGTGLYDVVLQSLGVSGSEVVHLGDDAEADGAAARRAGLHTALLPRRPGPLPQVLQKEGFVGDDALARRRAPLVDGAHDGGLTALRAKALRRSDAPPGPGSRRTCWDTGAAVLGPVFTGFADWVHARAAATGGDQLACLMREGAFLARLLARPDGPRVSTLWASRLVCSQAAVVDVSAAELEVFLARRRPPTLAVAAAGLGLDVRRLHMLGADERARLDDPTLRRAFLAAVSGEPELRDAVAEHCAQVRRRLVQHVLDVAGRDDGELLLVDVGWGASIQWLLDRALRAQQVGLRTRGLYLMTNDAAAARVLGGVTAEGFLGNLGEPGAAVRWVTRSPEVLEQVCMPDSGSLQGFDVAGTPVTAPDVVPAAQQAERRAVQDGVLAFQQEWQRYAPVVGAAHPVLHEQRDLLRTVLLRFVVDPTPDEAAVLGAWQHDENQGSDAAHSVIEGLPPERLPYLTPLQLLDLPMSSVYWPFALAARHHPPLARAAAAVALGELPAEVFTSGEERTTTLYVDHGLGLLPRRQSPAPSSSYGLSFVRHAVEAHPLHGVGIRFPAGPGLVRLDWMTLRLAVRGQDDVVVDVRWPQGHPSLHYDDGVLVAGNLLHGARRAPRLSFRCPDEWAGSAYRAELEIGFAWLPATADAPAAKDASTTALELARRVRPRARALVTLGRALASRTVR